MTDNIARLLALMGAGGSGGTTDYEALTNKPAINGVTLIGDLTLAELGIIVDDQLNAQSTNPVQNAVLTALLNAFPYANITSKPQINGVTLTGNVTLAQLGLNALWVGTQAEYAEVASTLAEGALVVITDDNDIDSTPTENSTNMVTSGGVYAFVVQGLSNKVDKVQGKGLSTEDYTTAEKTKLGGIEAEANKTIVDSALSGSSTNPVQNKVVTNALNGKQDTLTIDTTPTAGSSNPVTSNGVFQELKKLKIINENPENHNGIYRGKDLTNVYTIEQIYERVHDGSFEDLYLGDFFTVHLTTDLMTRFTGSAFESGMDYYEMDSGTDVTQRTWTVTQDETPQEGKVYATKEVIEEDVDYMIAGFDLYEHIGKDSSTMINNHHLIIIPKYFYKTGAAYHYDGLARTGYTGSDMHNIVLPCYAESTRAALHNHVLKHMSNLNGTVDASVPSMCGAGLYGATVVSEWAMVYAQLMTEQQCLGSSVMSSSFRDVGLDYNKFPVFNYINPHELHGTVTGTVMLRTFAHVYNNLEYFATLTPYGRVTSTSVKPTNKGGVLPFYLFG